MQRAEKGPAAPPANPYRPGFSELPQELAGREEVLEEVVEAIDVAGLEGRMPRPIMLVGARGFGKSVLLARAGQMAETRGAWPRVHVELQRGRPFAEPLLAELERANNALKPSHRNRKLKVDSAAVRAGLPGLGAELRLTHAVGPGPAPTALRDAFAALSESALTRGMGIVLTVDEAHLARHQELGELAAALQEGVRRGWPIVSLFAGLPAMQDPRRSVTYLERAAWYDLGALSRTESLSALQRPAEISGRPMNDDAAVLLAESAGGYPYALQLYGHHAWRKSSGRNQIDEAAARASLERANNDLDRSLWRPRWQSLSPQQRRYLQALAALEGQGERATGRAVADRLARNPKQLSSTRDRLLKQGVIVSDGQQLRFLMPSLREYVTRAIEPRPTPGESWR